MGSREPCVTSACWGKANFLQNFRQLESRPYTNNFLRGQKMLFPIRQVEQNRIQSLAFSVLPMKRQLLCQGDTGEQSELSPLQEIEVAISARQFATSLAASVQLCCEMSLAAKPKQLFFFPFWRVIFNPDHSAIPLTGPHEEQWQHREGEESCGRQEWIARAETPPTGFLSKGHVLHHCPSAWWVASLMRPIGMITWRLCSRHFSFNEVVYVWLYNAVLQAYPNLFIQLQNRMEELNFIFKISHWINN